MKKGKFAETRKASAKKTLKHAARNGIGAFQGRPKSAQTLERERKEKKP